MIDFFAGLVQHTQSHFYLFKVYLIKLSIGWFSCIHYTALNDKMVLYNEVEMI